MRTRYEIEDTEGYLAARELLLRRCGSWAAANDRPLSLPLAGTLLDSRHLSSDGRLGFWTPSQVRRALLTWIPGKVTAPQEDLLAAPETLRSVLRYLDATGLRDPRGAAIAENEAAIDTAAKEFGAAIADQERYGPAKTAMLSAEYGDAGSRLPDGLASFLQVLEEDLPVFDAAKLEDLLERQLLLPSLGQERPLAQLPVRLPAREELADAAERSMVVGQFRALAEWLGPEGRALTPAKDIRPADARELIALLGTGDEGLKFHSAAELPGLNLVVSWALKARLIRRQGTRLLPVAKARPLLADAEALWQRAFDAAFDIGPAVCHPIWADEPPSPTRQMYDVVVPDLMATIYSMEEPVPVPRLAESVWETVKAHFDVDLLGPLSLMGLRARVDNDVEHIFDAFEALGAVTTVQGMASEIFSMDLDDGTTLPFGIEPTFEAGPAAALRERLAKPARLAALTPLGTRAMRERMLAEGREAGLVGELAGATAAEMLGTVAEHYTTSSAPEEIAIWRAAHGGSLDPLHHDGVDISDSASVNTWIAQQNAGVFAAHAADPLTWDGVDLKEAFGIPDVVAPVRLPDEEALTALAVAAPLLADLRGLARDVRDVREGPVRAASVDPLLLALASEVELVERDGDTLIPGEDVEWLDDLTEGAAALEAWDYAFAQVLDTTLGAADETDPQAGEDLDLAGHGIALVTELFLGGRAGVPVTQLSESLKSAAIAEVPPDAAERQWEEWAGAHGDPADLLLGQLAKLSAVTVAGEVARLEPLALHSVAAKLRACDVSVPDLPPPGEMTADDVVLLAMFGTEEDFAADFASWVAQRTPEEAAWELLAFAAGEDAAVRTAAVRVVARLGDAAEPALREALDRRELRCYAKMALIEQLAGRDPDQPVPAELERTTEDLAWLVADNFAPLTRAIDRNATFPFDMAQLSEAGWDVSNEALFDAMTRLDHPDAQAVLTMLGKHCDDKKTAKAARKAAFKAVSRRASRRS